MDLLKHVSSLTDQAAEWMNDRAQEAREGIHDLYTGTTDTVKDKLIEATPTPFREGAAAILGGSQKIGQTVLDFVDPVGFALETGGAAIQTWAQAPVRATKAINKIAHGDASGFKDWGENYLDSMLVNAQVASFVVPSGHVAAKAAKQPIKATRKAIKSEMKSLPKGSIERKAAKQDLHKAGRKKIVASRTARESAQLAKQIFQDSVATGREALGVHENIQLPKRDWSKLGLESPTAPLKKRKGRR